MKATKFKLIFDDGFTKTKSAKFINPEFTKSWWSFDKEGEEKYTYKDHNDAVMLGKKMYFHIETKGIPNDAELKLQLFDHDYYLFDWLNWDDDVFPDKEIIKTIKVKRAQGSSFGTATLELPLDDKWDIMIKDDSDYHGNLNNFIELYWKTTYKGLEENLPIKEDDYLRVGIERDLYLKPMADQANGLPEIYDSKGCMYYYGLATLGASVTKDTLEEIGVSGKVSRFISTKIRITKETTLLADINAIKRKLSYQQIDLATNSSKTLGYEVVNASDFVIKKGAKFIDIEESTVKTAKKFSDYFNAKDIAGYTKKGLDKALKVIDYVEMGKALFNLLPKDDGIATPNPIDILNIAAIGSPLGTPLGLICLTADIVVTPIAKDLIKTLEQDSKNYMDLAKLKGLEAVRNFLLTDSAKFGGYTAIDNVPQATHDKVMRGEIDTFIKLDESKMEENRNFSNETNTYYYYIIQDVKNPNRLDKMHIIDSIFVLESTY